MAQRKQERKSAASKPLLKVLPVVVQAMLYMDITAEHEEVVRDFTILDTEHDQATKRMCDDGDYFPRVVIHHHLIRTDGKHTCIGNTQYYRFTAMGYVYVQCKN